MSRTSKFLLSVILIFLVIGGLVFYMRSSRLPMAQPKSKVVLSQPKVSHVDLKLPHPDHIVIVVEENHAYKKIIGNSSAPYMNALAKKGVLFTQSYAVTHPSQPNYIALFSGSTQGVTSDRCPHSFSAPNLASELINKGLTFSGYSEDLPSQGFTGCHSNLYYRKHAPWVNFTNVPSKLNKSLKAFPQDFSLLPTVSFVIPNLDHDMHNGTIEQADQWLKEHIDPYVQWAKTHNSLLIVTWDEDDHSQNNKIPTFMVGPMVLTGASHDKINHYSVLQTIEDMYGLPLLDQSQNANPIKSIWVNTSS